MPFFSIVIPTYNRAYIINNAIKSCIGQTFQDFEIIIVDDCSSDNIADVIESYHMDNIKLIKHKKNAGAGAARNTGIRAANGKYIAFLDSDDIWLPHKLEKYAGKIQKQENPHSCLFYSAMYLDSGFGKLTIKNIRPKKEDESILDYHFVEMGVMASIIMCAPKELLLKVPFNESLKICEDISLSVDLEKHGVNFVMIEEPLSTANNKNMGNRVSVKKEPQLLLEWLETVQAGMSPKSLIRFRAMKLAPLLAKNYPLTALNYIYTGYKSGFVPLKYSCFLVFKTFCPDFIYVELRRLKLLILAVITKI